MTDAYWGYREGLVVWPPALPVPDCVAPDEVEVASPPGVEPEFPVPVLLLADVPAALEVPEFPVGEVLVAPWTVELPTTVPVPLSEPVGPLL